MVVLMQRVRKTYRNHLRCNKSNLATPLLRRVVQDIVHSESGIFLGQLIQILLQQNILLAHISEQEINLGLVLNTSISNALSSSNYSADNLQHGRDSGSASNHTEMSDHVWSIDHCALWTLDLDRLSDNEGGHIFRDVSSRVRFNEKVKVTRDMVG